MAELITLARPYAKAAFETAQAENRLAEWSEVLAFAAQVTANSDVRALLASPRVADERKADFLIELFGEGLSDSATNFVKLLAENQRLALLPHIHTLFETARADLERTVDIEVSAPYELTEEQQQKLSQALSKKLERKVSLATTVDTSLIGGVVVRTGDMVIDASVRGKLTKMAEALSS
ncbi:F0F1 ATP synthase subunit delta [Hydrocarboniclastica marina]|uniref:ATP synthase subunit delta n=1 Tax=Hydrocarboniclastica marina TaxID=2259620 RepID=A0A4P7XKN9_9ALTE|nr:F0F1 ATP synthase subunit delta [Hydrocarboniclastica marina]MAM00442.1 F0F1 ATP synthase subunit delta [Alteromonadaceae bacterium]QCF27701.1 F0F1 ATP synthase subunit delta [Hydrocarboniclastica marina]|tara:strand:+ start:7957 stop:8493 length:537 start_codon:yes stop_codon:yes gene_type:complete